jgi:hypothetical protein
MTASMRARYLLVLAACAVATLSTASAAGLNVTSNYLTPVQTCLLSAYPATATAEADSMVEQHNPTTTYGGNNYLYVESRSNYNMRAYLSFALSSCAPAIPSNATVTSAVLRLYAYTVATSCRTYDLFRVGVGGTTYGPGSLAWTAAAIDWNNQPAGTAINNPPASDATGSEQVGTGCPSSGIGTSDNYANWTVTTDVAAFVNGTAANHGWMIRDDTENATLTTHTYYRSENYGSSSQEPQLVVSYVP